MRIIDIINENFNEIPKGMAENPYQRRIIEKNMDEVIAFVKTGQLDPTGDLFYEMYEYYANEIPVHIRQNPRKLAKVITAKIAPMLKFYGERATAGYHSTKKHEPLNPNRPAKTTVHETATAGATSAGNIATVDAPQLSPGKARGKKSYTGTPGKSGTKAPPQPKVVQPKTASGTAKNALDMKGANLFGGAAIKRS